jgi:hypothetical protein
MDVINMEPLGFYRYPYNRKRFLKSSFTVIRITEKDDFKNL